MTDHAEPVLGYIQHLEAKLAEVTALYETAVEIGSWQREKLAAVAALPRYDYGDGTGYVDAAALDAALGTAGGAALTVADAPTAEPPHEYIPAHDINGDCCWRCGQQEDAAIHTARAAGGVADPAEVCEMGAHYFIHGKCTRCLHTSEELARAQRGDEREDAPPAAECASCAACDACDGSCGVCPYADQSKHHHQQRVVPPDQTETTPAAVCALCVAAAEREPKLALTEHSTAFCDAFPSAPGHTLIVPRRHVARIAELTYDEAADLWATALAQINDADGYTIGVNDGHAAGQTVPHVHLHVIPRTTGDVPDPRGGIRWAIPGTAAYWDQQRAQNPNPAEGAS